MSIQLNSFSSSLVLYLLAGYTVSAVAEDGVELLSDWSLNGQNTIRVEQYDDFGDKTSSPYPQVGIQAYDDISLFGNKRVSAFEKIDVQAFGTVNDSEYRSTDTGFILERGKVAWEKGDTELPFRVEFGDVFAQQTFRTLQRSLKGVQLEFQPQLSANRKHSIQLFSGLSDAVYRELDEDVNVYAGGSWLMEDKRFGALSFTSVYNYQEGAVTATTNAADTDQWVNSLAWAKDFTMGDLNFEAESELAYFTGDTTDNNILSRNSDFSAFGQINGRTVSMPLTYRLRYERNGDNFQPAGASVSSDQETMDSNVGWLYASGLQLRGRLQRFRTALETTNHTDTDVVGMNLSGPFFNVQGYPIRGQLDAYQQDVENEDSTVNNLTRSVNASLSLALTDRILFRPGVFYTHLKNQNGGAVTVNRQLSLPFDYRFTTGRFSGTLSPGLVLRNNTGGGSDGEDINPTLSLILNGGPHSIQASYNALIQDADLSTSIDATTQQSSFRYTYSKDKHQFGIDADYFDRDPQPGAETEAYRVGAFWTYYFDKPARVVPSQSVRTVAAASTSTGILGQLRLIDLAPGTLMDEIETKLTSLGIQHALPQGNLSIYETRLYDQIERRQRLGVISSGGVLDKSVLVVNFRNTGDVDSVAQTYERVREILNNRYGAPEVQFEEGGFTVQLARDLNAGRFRRLNEWSTPAGKLRFGIPNRTDGQIRMEIIHADSFPPYANNNWGIEELR